MNLVTAVKVLGLLGILVVSLLPPSLIAMATERRLASGWAKDVTTFAAGIAAWAWVTGIVLLYFRGFAPRGIVFATFPEWANGVKLFTVVWSLGWLLGPWKPGRLAPEERDAPADSEQG